MLRPSSASRHICKAIEQIHRRLFSSTTVQSAELASESAFRADIDNQRKRGRKPLAPKGTTSDAGKKVLELPTPRHRDSSPSSGRVGESERRNAARKAWLKSQQIPKSQFTGVRFIPQDDRWRGQINIRRNPEKGATEANKWILCTPYHETEEAAALEVACLRYISEQLQVCTSRFRFINVMEIPESLKEELDVYVQRGIQGILDFMYKQRQLAFHRSRVIRGEKLGCRFRAEWQKYRIRFQRSLDGHHLSEVQTYNNLEAAAKCYDRLCYVFDRVYGLGKFRHMNVGLSEDEMKYLDQFDDWNTFLDVDRLLQGKFPKRSRHVVKQTAVSEYVGTEAFSALWEKSKESESRIRLRRESLDRYRRRTVFPPYGVMDVTAVLADQHTQAQRVKLLKWTDDVKAAATGFIVEKLLQGKSTFAQRSLAKDKTDILITVARGSSGEMYQRLEAEGLPRVLWPSHMTDPLIVTPGTDRNKYWAPILAGGPMWLQMSVLVAFQKYHEEENLYCTYVSKERVPFIRHHTILLWISKDLCWLLPPSVVSEGVLPDDFEGGFLGIRRGTAWELRDYSMFGLTEAELSDRLNTIFLEARERMLTEEPTGEASDPLTTWQVANHLGDDHILIEKVRAAERFLQEQRPQV